MQRTIICLTVLLSFLPTLTMASEGRHPNLMLTVEDAVLIRENLGRYPLFDAVFDATKQKIDKVVLSPIDVPVPVDAAGTTHERHKQNAIEMEEAGVLYAVTKDERYARFIREMLLKYAALYPTLGKHPRAGGESYGKLFWQMLNETVWLVHTIQAYDCVYDRLLPSDRATIEQNVFRPMARFFTEDHSQEFNRIHNHGTWAVTAVGMTGFVLQDTDLVAKALYGTNKDRTGGFLRQIDLLFSPDGYYTEGAYYARYALMPFVSFAEAIEHNRPDLKIFQYRNQVLKKTVYALLQQTTPTGEFIPINDALKQMNYLSPEVVLSLDVAYRQYGEDRNLLSVAKRQNCVVLSGAGLAVARGLTEAGPLPAFPYRSIELRDGPNGEAGGLGILRSGAIKDQSMLVLKYTAHGQSHGHYDKLAMLYYDQSREVLQDYGSVRFVNVDPKYGGRYLPENKSFAMQTIAHNTLTVDEQSDYRGKMAVSELHHADHHFFSSGDSSLQVISATVNDAYNGVTIQRTMALVSDPGFPRPIVIDVVRVVSEQEHQYDLPFYYEGQFISTNVKYEAHDKNQKTLGKANGYQHLWNEAEGTASGPVQVCWLTGGRFYTITSSGDSSAHVFFCRIGASDPKFNLRNDPAVILRARAREHVFASVIEPHGAFDESHEFSRNATGLVKSVTVLASSDEGTVVGITGEGGMQWHFMVANGTESASAKHTLPAHGIGYSWNGNYELQKN